MSEVKHTLEALEVFYTNGNDRCAEECRVVTLSTPSRPARRTIALLNDDVPGHRNAEYARLFAMAPKMLKALKDAAYYLDGLGGPYNHELLNIKDVIRKAEGGL